MRKQGAVSLFAVVIACGLGAGCASADAAYQRSESRAVAGLDGFQFDDASVEESFARVEQATFPLRLAVAGVETNRYGVFEDPEAHQFEAALAGQGDVFTDVLPLPDFMSGRGCRDVASLRRAAARAHADVVLLYDQKVSIREEGSPLQVLNVTVLGCWLVPSESYEVALDTRAALVDVRNGLVYTTARDARAAEGSAPSALVGDRARDTKRRLREESFAALRESLAAKVARMRTAETGGSR